MSILTLIGDHSALLATIGILGFIPSAGYVVYRQWINPAVPPLPTRSDPAHATTRTARPAPPAAEKPAPAERPAPVPSLQAGQQEHQLRGQAKTIKVAPAPAQPEPGRSPTQDTEPIEAQRRAERLGELGFHTTAPAEKAKADAPVGDQPVTIPSQANELDDILNRIDRVLADNPVMATSTTAGTAAVDTALKKDEPATVRTETTKPSGDDQQKLF